MAASARLPRALPVEREWTVVRGDDESITVAYPDGYDLTGYAFKLQLRDTPDHLRDDGAAIVDVDGLIAGVEATMTVGRAITRTLTGRLWYAVRATTPGGTSSYTIMKGPVALEGVAVEGPA